MLWLSLGLHFARSTILPSWKLSLCGVILSDSILPTQELLYLEEDFLALLNRRTPDRPLHTRLLFGFRAGAFFCGQEGGFDGFVQSLSVIVTRHIADRAAPIHEDLKGKPADAIVGGRVYFHRSLIFWDSDGKVHACLGDNWLQIGFLIRPDTDHLKAVRLVFLPEQFEIWELQNACRSEGCKISQQYRFSPLFREEPRFAVLECKTDVRQRPSHSKF